MNNIVDAVNQNSTNAIQAAVLARLFGGAQANPVIGGVNQAEPPVQDFVSNAMNNPKPTVMPQLAGARGEVSGRGGAMGGIGDALMNMYNSRIARSENEIRQAESEASRLQKLEDNKQAIINEQNAILFKENTPAAKELRDLTKLQKEALIRSTNLTGDIKEAKLSGSTGRRSGGDGQTGNKVVDNTPSGFRNLILAEVKTYDPITRQPIITHEDEIRAYQKFLLTKPNQNERIAAEKYIKSTTPEAKTKELKKNLEERLVEEKIRGGQSLPEAIADTKREIAESIARGKVSGEFKGYGDMGSTPQPPTTQPQVAPVIPPNAVIKVDEQGRRYYEN